MSESSILHEIQVQLNSISRKEFYRLLIKFVSLAKQIEVILAMTKHQMSYLPNILASISKNSYTQIRIEDLERNYLNYITFNGEIDCSLFSIPPSYPFCSWSDEKFYAARRSLRRSFESLNEPEGYISSICESLESYISCRSNNIIYADNQIKSYADGISCNRFIYGDNTYKTISEKQTIMSNDDQEVVNQQELFEKSICTIIRRREYYNLVKCLRTVATHNPFPNFNIEEYFDKWCRTEL